MSFFRDADRIDWTSFVPGDLLAIELQSSQTEWTGAGRFASPPRMVQGTYLGCEVAKGSRYLRIMGPNVVETVACSAIRELKVMSSISDSREE